MVHSLLLMVNENFGVTVKVNNSTNPQDYTTFEGIVYFVDCHAFGKALLYEIE